MIKLLLVALGGSLGAVSRYLLGGLAQSISNQPGFPVGTLTVNVLGCFVIGLLSALGERYQLFTLETRALVFTGFLGAFTTFSTFSFENVTLLREGQNDKMLLYLGLSLGLGLTAVWLGDALVKLING